MINLRDGERGGKERSMSLCGVLTLAKKTKETIYRLDAPFSSYSTAMVVEEARAVGAVGNGTPSSW